MTKELNSYIVRKYKLSEGGYEIPRGGSDFPLHSVVLLGMYHVVQHGAMLCVTRGGTSLCNVMQCVVFLVGYLVVQRGAMLCVTGGYLVV